MATSQCILAAQWRPVDEQISVLPFPDQSAIQALTPEGGRAYLRWAEQQPNTESMLGVRKSGCLIRLCYTHLVEEYSSIRFH